MTSITAGNVTLEVIIKCWEAVRELLKRHGGEEIICGGDKGGLKKRKCSSVPLQNCENVLCSPEKCLRKVGVQMSKPQCFYFIYFKPSSK